MVTLARDSFRLERDDVEWIDACWRERGTGGSVLVDLSRSGGMVVTWNEIGC